MWRRSPAARVSQNSNALKHRDTHAVDLQREREEDAKREARRAAKEARLAAQKGEMAVEPSSSATAGVDMGDVADALPRKKAFGKVAIRKKLKVGKKEKQTSVSGIRPSLELRKRQGIRKPSAIMRKTLKKMQKKREAMELG
jgi:hypothetical protein